MHPEHVAKIRDSFEPSKEMTKSFPFRAKKSIRGKLSDAYSFVFIHSAREARTKTSA